MPLKMRTLILCFAASLLSACGFTPLYSGSEGQGLQADLAAISITPEKSRQHQLLRRHLTDRMNANGSRYSLTVKLSQESLRYGIKQDASATQEKLTMTAAITLIGDAGPDAPLMTESFSRSLSYDLVQSDYATLTKREDSEKRLIKALADDIHRAVSVYFYQKHQKKGQ